MLKSSWSGLNPDTSVHSCTKGLRKRGAGFMCWEKSQCSFFSCNTLRAWFIYMFMKWFLEPQYFYNYIISFPFETFTVFPFEKCFATRKKGCFDFLNYTHILYICRLLFTVGVVYHSKLLALKYKPDWILDWRLKKKKSNDYAQADQWTGGQLCTSYFKTLVLVSNSPECVSTLHGLLTSFLPVP